MDFWSRLIGGTYKPRKPAVSHANDPQARLARFKRAHTTVQHLCDQPRNLAKEKHTLDELQKLFDRLAQLIRDESRAPAPHLCLQYAAANQIYALITRAAIIGHHEGLIYSTITLLSTLIDSEEEDFLSSQPFAKSLMRLITRVVDSGNLLLGIETETAILELLFTIAAKIRLQPYILPVWFASSSKAEPDDVSLKEKKDFVGATQADDFPLCYLLIGRVHHEGRIGDFARTGLLYIFEATGRSKDLEEWVVSSDLPTLMASGLGALYSQLSRELSILHPDATLPPVLAMSDYSTTHARATAESAFSERHRAHIATFLSYLAFWQDVLDHCRSSDVKQTLLDHFQILFLQQLLYPSILQSSDTDAGSSVAVLTYVSTILEALEYPDLIHNILTYLLAITDAPTPEDIMAKRPRRASMPPRSPTAVKRRQSLMLMAAPPNPEDAVEPSLFNLVDLMSNSLGSSNSQTVYAALNLVSTILIRQKKYAFETLLKVRTGESQTTRTAGMLELEVEKYTKLSSSLHGYGTEQAYASLAEDVRLSIEAQVDPSLSHPTSGSTINAYTLPKEDPFMRLLAALLRTFLTNSPDVNLALTQTLTAIALCTELRLDPWFSLDPSTTPSEHPSPPLQKPWQNLLDPSDHETLAASHRATTVPPWPHSSQPLLHTLLQTLNQELASVRARVPNLDALLSARKTMLQAASLDPAVDAPPLGSRHASASATARNESGGVAAVASLFRPPPPLRGGTEDAPSTTDVLMQRIPFPAVDGGQGAEGAEIADASEAVEASDGSDGAEGVEGTGYTEHTEGAERADKPEGADGDEAGEADDRKEEVKSSAPERSASLNHVLTNAVILQEFVLELVAVLQVRAAVLGEREVKFVA